VLLAQRGHGTIDSGSGPGEIGASLMAEHDCLAAHEAGSRTGFIGCVYSAMYR
jgi:hypothetical protein